MTINQVCQWIEEIAPLSLQEEYDNAGLQIGDRSREITGVLLTLDVTEKIIEEAIAKHCNLIIAHHPLLFKGLKQITGNNYTERCVISAIQHNIAIYAAHTNLDNINIGVNRKIAEKLSLQDCHILAPQTNQLLKLITFVPITHADTVRDALFAAGAGSIGNYDACSFNSEGIGTFRANEGTHPFVGDLHEWHHEKEIRIEVIACVPQRVQIEKELLKAHPYEEPAFDWIVLQNPSATTGTGMLGTLSSPVSEIEFLQQIKDTFQTPLIRHTALLGKPIHKVALCGGSGSFLLPAAIAAKADVYISADFKYHEFFNADNRLLIADVGHYESEQFTKELLKEQIQKKIPTFALHLSTTLTNPVQYF